MTENSGTDVFGLKRRAFIASAAAAALSPLPALAAGRGIAFVVAPNDAVANSVPGKWATELLNETLAARGATVRVVRAPNEAASGEVRLLIAGAESAAARDILARVGAAVPTGPEALAVLGAKLDGNDVILACGSDARGLVYAVTEIADRIVSASGPDTTLTIGAALLQRPANKVRSIARCFESEVEDKAWLHDRAFWTEYLTMLVANRVNRFSLTFGLQYNYPMEVSDVYLYFAYPFLFAVPNYDVAARGLPDEERDQNFVSLKFIAEETVRRGMDFQLGLWTHGYKFDSPRVNYLVEGITPENHAAYCADAIAKLLTDVPQISGVTLRIHGESGIPEGDYDFWQAVFSGIKRVGRPIGIDMHSKGIDSRTIDLALATGLPVTVSPKYLGEHIGLPYHESAMRGVDVAPVAVDGHFALSEGSRRFTRYSFGDFLREDRKYGIVWRVWPGTQRVLAWADPIFFAGYGRFSGFCGAGGIEICEPLSFKGRMGSGRAGGRTGYSETSLIPARDWQKYSLFYRLWGRLTYDPSAPPDGWRRAFTQAFGPGAGDVEQALSNASRILPLVTLAHGPSASNNSYWPEVYTNMPIVRDTAGRPYYDTAQPARFGTVESFDPQMFATIEQTAGALIQGQAEARYSPIDVAGWLDGFATAALTALEAARRAQTPNTAEFQRLSIDIQIAASIGRFFANKMRAAVLWSLYQRSEDATAGTEAIRLYTAARDWWAGAAQLGAVYEADLSYGPEPWLRGHWRDRLPAIDADLAEMARLAGDTNGMDGGRQLVSHERIFSAIGQALATPQRARLAVRHVSPGHFVPGQKLALAIGVPDGVASVRLHFRHVNQAETWQVADMAGGRGKFSGEIPAAYTSGPYPLQYYFELRQQDTASLYPGLAPDLANQPYLVARATPSS